EVDTSLSDQTVLRGSEFLKLLPEPSLCVSSAPDGPADVSRCLQVFSEQMESFCGSGLASVLRGQHSPENAARERSRVRNLRQAFHSLQAALPSVPPDTKLSKLDVLVLATNYIAYLTETLDQGGSPAEQALPPRHGGYLHPVKVRTWGVFQKAGSASSHDKFEAKEVDNLSFRFQKWRYVSGYVMLP
uniref:BHLH domain-containing protein n=1 Tax=Oryzias latipes TaxID=8090 RepID=A0A3P9LPJ4_ORYLA